jgi:hypothetical protein
VPPVVVAIATAVSAAAADTVGLFTVSSAAIEAASSIGYAVGVAGVSVGISAGIGAALAPKIPDPQALQTPLKQPMSERQSATGRVRVSGSLAYFGTGNVGAATNLSINIHAMLDGRSQGLVSFYLNDDLMAPVGDYWYAPGAPAKYGGGGSNLPNLVQMDYRLGLDTETSYSEIEPALDLWDASHRGDGVTSLAVYCTPARREDQQSDFPNGDPVASAVFDAQLLFDPRDVGQTQGDKSTYVFTENAPLGLLGYLTDATGGMGLDYARFLAPAMDISTAAFDEADGLVATSGMHATLLDAAAVGDNKIFLADTTGLTVGATVQLATENVTVSGFGLAGEVDLTGVLLYAHSAGELAYWSGFGQTPLYRAGATYSHGTPPGDVVKSYLSTFDGWCGQRGDGALVIRTNTIYEPTVVLTDRHILGYQVQHFLPDEQATNQYIVSYTDPASGFNKAEAGYVEDDDDIAARGTVRSNELYLQWVPSAPQALTVARAMLARSTQALRGTVTCSLAGLPAMGERYVRLQIAELPDLNDAIVEITGKVSIDLSTMTVSFPWVLATDVTTPPTPAPTPNRVQEVSQWSSREAVFGSAPTAGSVLWALGTGLSPLPVNTADGWAIIDTYEGITSGSGDVGAIYGVVAWKRAGASESTTQVPFSGSVSNNQDATSIIEIEHCGDLPGALESLTWASPVSPTSGTGNADATATAVTAYDNDFAVCMGGWVYVWPFFDTLMITGAGWGFPHGATGAGSSATVVASQVVATAGTTVSGTVDIGHPWHKLIAVVAVFNTQTRYTLPPLGPPSGSPLQPLDAPTIISVTPNYLDSGGGVQGARLLVEVDDPAADNATWKLQWKKSGDSLWTQLPGPLDAEDVPPLTIQTGLIAASGSIDVQVAYVTASQVSPWSATTTVSVAAPSTVATTLTASEALTAGQIVSIWSSSGAAKVRKANATDDTKSAHGFVLANVLSGATATIYLPGQVVTGLVGLTPGATYYLDTTGGAITDTQPSTSGNLVQRVGFALSATTLLFEPEILSEA